MFHQSTFSPLLDELIAALRCLPGVGPKTAQRMAFHLLTRARQNGQHLATTMQQAVQNIRYCERCHTLSEQTLCRFCQDQRRDEQLLCIVETPSDVLAIEQSHSYRGFYYVLMGHLSPLDGIGPEQLGLEKLTHYLQTYPVKEIIIATNPTVEGEATAHYITELVKPFALKVSRIAYGVPLGGELEYIDSGTLARAITQRDILSNSKE